MKAIMITYDSLKRNWLPNYGSALQLPGFEQLGRRCTRFDNCYAGSLPCIPARREMHTGRENFLHACWAPLEPFDDSMPEILAKNGIYSHLVSDHVHYWEDAGFAYHSRYSSFEFVRGQEGDPVYGRADRNRLEEQLKDRRVPHLRAQDLVNRSKDRELVDFPQSRTFEAGLQFLEENRGLDNWFLHIETFDPHEPFRTPEEFRRAMGISSASSQDADWPDYRLADRAGDPERVESYRREYAALLGFCDDSLKKVLDRMDEYDLWKDTMLIVNTDHGFLIGEHGWLGKNTGPYYNEVAHIPLFIHDPRNGHQPASSDDLVQTVDLPATVLDFFGLPLPKDMTGMPIREGRRTEKRDCGIFGFLGGQLNLTDGRYVYMRAPRSGELPYHYTLAGVHFLRGAIMSGSGQPTLQIHEPFSFTKGMPVMQVGNLPNSYQSVQNTYEDLLFDLQKDPGQEHPQRDAAVEDRFCREAVRLLKELDAPQELYAYYGLDCE